MTNKQLSATKPRLKTSRKQKKNTSNTLQILSKQFLFFPTMQGKKTFALRAEGR
jgi:hypothetical protein